ncbi:iron-containing alcohol dehydrogenase [Candidatus Aerophobetes bacterium]|nr:iron-containing alcohol dehydrogenase [Candidatus Aerophobetes bacterium]
MISLMYPQHIIFGKGVINQLGERVGSLGSKALLVTGRSAMRKSGILEKVINQLSSNQIDVELFDKVEHDPSLTTVAEGIDEARKKDVSVVIGLGGGSAMDSAKTIAVIAKEDGTLEDYHEGKLKIKRPGLPFVAVPTTAGTGAEITNNAVLTNREKKLKKSIRSPFMIAKVALVDPELTLSCPPSLTAHSGMDALTQAIESFISKGSNPITDTLALRAIELIFYNLPLAFEDGSNISTREKVALGSLLSAMAFSNSGLGAVHGLSHPLGAHYNIPHGLACAVLLPWVLEYNLPVCKEKMDIIAKKIGVKRGEDVPDIIRDLLNKLKIPLTFKEWGIKKEDIPVLVKKSRSGSMAKNPREATDEDLENILKKVI